MAAGAQCLSPWANSVVVPQMPSWSSSSSTVFAQEEEGFSPPLSGRGGRVYDERRFFGSPSSSSTSSTSPGYTETETATFYDGSYQVVTNSPYYRRLQMLHQDPSSSASCSTDAAAVYLNCLNNNPLTNRLTPLTPSGPPNPYATAPHHQFSMPGQSVASAQMPYTVTRNGYNSGAGTPRPGSGAGKRTGGRRPKEEEYYFQEHPLNEEDRDKRDKRRQRNKEAAARCRQRRLDLMSTLQNEVDNLKQRNNAHEALIDQLKNEKDVLIRALTSHGCKIPNQVSSNLASLIPTTTVPSYITASVPSSQSSVTQPLGLKRPHPDGNIYTVPLTSIKTELDNDYIPSSISSNGVSTAGSMLPPPLKKIQNQNQPPHSRHNTSQEPTLTQVNAPAGNEMERPSTLPIPGATSGVDGGYDESKSGLWSGMPSITTPSGIMNDGTYPFLYTDTGLTPVSAQPALPVCTLGTPTPLGDNELRPL